jgi:lipopolysaccharide export system protein LptC
MFESLFRNKTLRYRALLVLLCLYVGAVILDQTINPDQANLNPTPQLNEPDLYMINASISQINSRGELQSKIAAERFTHYPLTDVTALDRPNLELFAQDSDMPWTISSSQGRLLEGSKYRKQAVELWNSVLAEKEGPSGEKTTFTTQTLQVYPDENLAESDAEVSIFTRNTKTSAAGLRANLNQDEFAFYSSAKQRVITTIHFDL